MKIDEHITPRSRMLLFSTLELLRQEIRPKFSDWKDADDWLFSQLDFTKDELAQIYKNRGVLYYDGSAVDIAAAKLAYEAGIPDFAKTSDVVILGQNLYFKNIKVFLNEEGTLLCMFPDESEPRHLRSCIQDVGEGDAFFYGETGAIRTTSDAAHQNFDEADEPWIVYGDDGDVYFEEDIVSDYGNRVRDYLFDLAAKQKKNPALSNQIQSASARTNASLSELKNNFEDVKPRIIKEKL